MTKFKVGDRVKVIRIINSKKGSMIYDNLDKKGIIKILDKLNGLYEIQLEGESNYQSHYEEELELATVPNTKIARKLYPNAKIVGDKLELI